MTQSVFLTVEGIEGVGKSTIMQFIDQFLSQEDIPHQLTREPGGTEIAEQIRQILLSKHQEKMSQDTELLLMFASRAQHIAGVIKPALAEGKWIICDRFTDSSFAYQGGGRGIALDRISQLETWVQGDFRPDCTLLLDAPVDIALARANKRGEPDRIESEKHDFFERIREAYLDRAKQYPHQYRIVDATQPLEHVKNAIATILNSLLSKG